MTMKNRDAIATRAVAIAALYGLVCLAGAALAAAPAAAPAAHPAPPPVQMTAAPPASADDPAKVAQAKQFLALFRPFSDPKNVAKQIDAIMPRVVAIAKKENPKLDVKKFAVERRAKILDQSAKIFDFQSHIVSRHFSLQELKGLTAFYGSPLGRKLANELPKVNRDIGLLGPLNKFRRAPRSGGPVAGQPAKGPTGGQTHK